LNKVSCFALFLLLSLSIIALNAFSLAGVQTYSEQTLTLDTPSKDASISNSGAMDNNNGADYRLDIGFDNSSDTTYRVLVQFNLPPTLSGENITSATLKLWGPTPWSSGFPSGEALRACRVTHDWVEGTGKSGSPTQDGITWNEYNYTDGLNTTANNWATPGGDYTLEDSSTVIIPPYPVTWASLNITVTNIVKGWASNAYPNSGFLIKLDTESGRYKGGIFDSKEYGQEYGNYSVLKLEINYTSVTPTPTPTSTPTPTPTPALTTTPTPTATSTPTPTSLPGTPTPTPMPTNAATNIIPTEAIYAAALIGIAVTAAVVILLFNKRKK